MKWGNPSVTRFIENQKSVSGGYATPGTFVLDPWKVWAAENLSEVRESDCYAISRSGVKSFMGLFFYSQPEKIPEAEAAFDKATAELTLDEPFEFHLGDGIGGLWYVYALSDELFELLSKNKDFSGKNFNLQAGGNDASHICMEMDSGKYFCVDEECFPILELCFKKV